MALRIDQAVDALRRSQREPDCHQLSGRRRQPMLGPDATYVQAKIDELNAAMAAQAAAHGADYVDLRSSSVGHDACALPGSRWVEGLVPLSDAFPMHPNALSMQNAAKVIAAQLAGGGAAAG